MKPLHEAVAILAAALLSAGAGAQDAPDVSGTWTVSLTTPMGAETHVLEIAEDGGARFDDAEVTPTIDGSMITFSAPQETPMGQITFSYTGVIAGDEMTGKADITGFPAGGPPGGAGGPPPGGPPPGGPGGPPPGGGPGGPGGPPPSFEWTATRGAE